MDCIRAFGGCSLLLPNKSSSSLSFSALTSSKVKPLALNAVMYFFTVFLDASAWAAIVNSGRCWLCIFSIFLILLMLIVKLAMLYEGVFALKRWLLLQHLLRVWGGQFPPECPGQFPPEWVVSLRRNVVVTFIRISKLITEMEIKSLALPALGCGNGGLDWVRVK